MEVEKSGPTRIECNKGGPMAQSQLPPVTSPDSLCNAFDSFLTYVGIKNVLPYLFNAFSQTLSEGSLQITR